MEMLYEAFCFADPIIFRPIESIADSSSRFEVSDYSVPEGWRRTERDVWVGLHPTRITVPDQGWKIHVSSTPENAEDILKTVWDFCVDHEIPFKFLRSSDIHLINNSKYASRSSSGKLITIYPCHDNHFDLLLTDLARALDGNAGPYILSDLRWGAGPLYLRYGAFQMRYCISRAGERIPAIEDSIGRLVPDIRQPTFYVPPWVDIPSAIARQIAHRKQEGKGTEFPYMIDRALHFSNGGGIYLGTRKDGPGQVVLREARPFAGLDAHGCDSVSRLKHEREILEQLRGATFSPNFIEYFTHWEHHYLVEEYIESKTLYQCIVERNPLIRYNPSDHDLLEYTDWALDILEQVDAALNTLHSLGIIFGDLHTNNVLVRPDGRVAMVDFEVATRFDERRGPALRAPGFGSQSVKFGFAVDDYALSCLRLAIFLPLTSMLDKDSTKSVALVKWIEERFPVPASYLRQVTDGLNRSQGSADARRIAVGTTTEPDILKLGWESLRASTVQGILASATPDQSAQLFPGDIEQFRYGGCTLAHGAAGVLYALHKAGVEVDNATSTG
jgi:class III lanthionine synthetase